MPNPIAAPLAGTESSPNQLANWWKKPHLRWIAGGACIVFLIALYLYPDSSGTAASALLATSKTDTHSVTLMAHMDTNAMTRGEEHILFVDIVNSGKDALSLLKLGVEAPGFTLMQPNPKDCHAPYLNTPADSLPADQSCTFRIPITSLVASGQYDITVAAYFRQPQYQILSVNLGHIRLHGLLGTDSLIRFGNRFSEVLKDLTLLLFLVVLTTLFNRWQKVRGEPRSRPVEQLHRTAAGPSASPE